MDDDWELTPNTRGNLAVFEFGPTADGQRETRWYIGFVNMVTGEIHVTPGARPGDDRPGDPQENPVCGDIVYVDWDVPNANRSEAVG